MCTVTYIPLRNNKFILASNRDETPLRKTLAPKTYLEEGVSLTYPKDALAGGTWIGISGKHRMVCLLNGGFVNHKRKMNYRMSRGVIVKNLLKSEDVMQEIETFNFSDIEPFTLVCVDWSQELFALEFVWDGNQKHVRKLDENPHIWSSSPLYDEPMKQERHAWFQNLFESEEEIDKATVLAFHQYEKEGDSKNSIKMKRPFVETVSTTVIEKNENGLELHYLDYLNEANTMQMKLGIQP
ncbi:MAG: hypothetical protein CMB99_02660 [Flavobacteriaceae bacterium]|nr:hypothetical protein [Flavobacteriaceae bacterium]|tara:strand:- start:98338 stop:99057 length:720 start_codon:yes stop_codon:yes gene_type:complete